MFKMTALKQEQLFDEIDVLPIDLKTKINKRKDGIESSKVTLVSGDEVFKKIANRLK